MQPVFQTYDKLAHICGAQWHCMLSGVCLCMIVEGCLYFTGGGAHEDDEVRIQHVKDQALLMKWVKVL
jgi:hypothetical protein